MTIADEQSGRPDPIVKSRSEEVHMKTLRDDTGKIDSATVAVLLGLSIGIGIAVHPAFLLVAAAIAMGALVARIFHAVQDHAEQTHLAYRAR